MEALISVLRALVDAAFSSGAITDLVQRDLHTKLDGAAAPPPAEPEPDLPAPTPAPEAPAAPTFGQESNPYA